MEHIIGFIILGLSILAAVGGILWKHLSWKKNQPKEEYRGVRYEYRPGAIEWADLKTAIDTMFEMLDKRTLEDLWVIIIPYGEPIKTSKSPTGYMSPAGRTAPEPKTPEEAANVYIFNGLTEFEKKFPISRTTAIAYVRQHRPSDGKIEARLRTGTGPIVATAARSALFHEVAEHIQPFRLDEGTNASHERKDLTELSRQLTVASSQKSKV